MCNIMFFVYISFFICFRFMQASKMATIGNVCLRTAIHGNKMVSSSRLLATSTLRWKSRNDEMIPTDMKQANNLEKWEMLAKEAGNDNPFATYNIKPDAATGISPSLPIMVPSMEDSRMVGCCCQNDYEEVVWFELKKGGIQRCDCGYYFKLIDYDPLDPRIKPKFGAGFGSGQSVAY